MRLAAAAVLVSVSGCAAASTAPGGAAATTAAPVAAAPATEAPVAQPTESNPPGDIPDNTVFIPYRSPDGAYEVKVPEGWARTDLPTGASFTDKLNSVKVELATRANAPTEATIRGEVPDVEIKKVDTVTRQSGKVVHAVYLTDSSPDPVTGKVVRDEVERFDFYRAGHEAVLTLSGPVGADNVDPWRTVSDSFRWTR